MFHKTAINIHQLSERELADTIRNAMNHKDAVKFREVVNEAVKDDFTRKSIISSIEAPVELKIL